MRYVPDGPEVDALLHLRLGPVPLSRAVPKLLLGTEPGIVLPAALCADTAAAVVLRLLRSAGDKGWLAGIEAATTDDFTGDRLLALWALCEPEAALARAEAIDDAARAAGFGVARSEAAAQAACFFRAYPDEVKVHEPALLYAALLPQVGRLLDRPRDFDLYWIGEYSDVLQSENLLGSGAVQTEDLPELDLTVLNTPLRLHDLTRFTATSQFRLLTVRSENTYTLEYRRESWVQFQSRRPLPRVDLRPLAQRLNLFERAAGAWRAQPLTDPTPRLFLDAGEGRPAPSTIDAQTVIAEVKDYLRDAARRPELHWSPYGGAGTGR
jgi:hypothetical protein